MNKLKAIKTVVIFLVFTFCQSLQAQIELNGQPIVTNATCQQIELGSIEVHVKPKHPPYTFNWSNGGTTEMITELEPGQYAVNIKDANGADTTLHFMVEENQCKMAPQLFFTPNGDGINDQWHINFSAYFRNALILVYNRFGQLVYQHTGEYNTTNHWEGTDLVGGPLPISTYFFVIYPDKSKKENILKGTVSIVR